MFHVVPTDGGTHPKDQDPTWLGNSVGHYEGDALVIDTTNFNGKTWIDTAQHPSSDQLHIVERIQYIDADHLSYQVTWEDPKAYTKPISNNRVFTRMKKGSETSGWWCAGKQPRHAAGPYGGRRSTSATASHERQRC